MRYQGESHDATTGPPRGSAEGVSGGTHPAEPGAAVAQPARRAASRQAAAQDQGDLLVVPGTAAAFAEGWRAHAHRKGGTPRTGARKPRSRSGEHAGQRRDISRHATVA